MAAVIGVYFSPPLQAVRALPDRLRVEGQALAELPEMRNGGVLSMAGGSVRVDSRQDQRLSAAAGETVTYKLFGAIPIKTVEVVRAERVTLIPGGTAVGITIRTEGVLVVGLGAVDTAAGAVSPGAAAGLRAGDMIVSADNQRIESAEQLMRIAASAGESLAMGVEREGQRMELTVRLVKSASDGVLRMGLWVRDSTAGVGTLSFVDPGTGWFAALGHPVSDIDTQSLLPVREGRIVPTEIVDVKTGQQGSPGELVGVFSAAGPGLGKILVNSEYGIFGRMEQPYRNALYESLPMGYCTEARVGNAELLATVSDGGIVAYACEIVRVNPQTSAAVKGMIVDVTDQRLLNDTGGIVQGMSGCPVIQDGRLIGVVTHVFVNDPTRGYCVYAEWMRERILREAS